jgi:uncharacterized Zn-binding protein involved in type VI secretion
MGQPAAKLGDKIVATDIHIILIPSPGGPVPTPTPLPFNGTILADVSTDVFIEGKPAATVFSTAINMPPHVPLGGLFQMPPSNQGKILAGSTGVFINGKPAARQGDRANTCNDPGDMPIGTVVAVGLVFIGETGAAAPVKPPPPPQTEPKLIKARLGQPGKITSVRWEKNPAKCGEKIKTIVETEDFKDGTPARFIIWEEDVDGKNDFIAQIDGKVQGNRVEADWIYSPEQLELDLHKEVEEKEGEPEYFFSVDIEGEEARSEILTFTHSLDIYLVDENGNELDGVEYTVILRGDRKEKGKLKKGSVRIEDAPYGKFTIEVEGYDFIVE